MPDSVYVTYMPPGFHSITPYLTTPDAPALISFLKAAFGATELSRTMAGDILKNCILQIGDSCFMVGQGQTMPSSFCLYVNDPDGVVDRAVSQGATVVMKVHDREDIGDRQGGVKDCAGNVWWVSKRLQECPYPQS